MKNYNFLNFKYALFWYKAVLYLILGWLIVPKLQSKVKVKMSNGNKVPCAAPDWKILA